MIKRQRKVIAAIVMIALAVAATAIVVFVRKQDTVIINHLPYLNVEVQKSGNVYMLRVSYYSGDTLSTDELTVTVNGRDASADWDEPELLAGFSATATLGVTLNIGDNISIVHEPSGFSLLTITLTKIVEVP